MYALKIFTDTRICHLKISDLAGVLAGLWSKMRGELTQKIKTSSRRI